MTPNESAEIIPEEFVKESNRASEKYSSKLYGGPSLAHADRSGVSNTSFIAGSRWAYRELAGQFPRWVKATERLPGDAITRAARRSDSLSSEFTSFTVEADRVFIGEEETYLIKDIPKHILNSLEWLEEANGLKSAPPNPAMPMPDIWQPFEMFPKLVAHIIRMAKTGLVGIPSEWNCFISALNDALVFEPEDQSWKEAKALRDILKWEFATDGRKFKGDHKEVLKQIISLAKEGLKPKPPTVEKEADQ